MKKLTAVINLLFILREVSGINAGVSVFGIQQTFNLTTQPAPSVNDTCYSIDLFQSTENCSVDGNVTVYNYSCIIDQPTLEASTFLQCNGTIQTTAQGISQFLNLTTLTRNTSYADRSDYDLSNCTISSDSTNITCAYFQSGMSQANTSNSTSTIIQINLTDTTVQLSPYTEFCENFTNAGSQQNINCTSSKNAFNSVQNQNCTVSNNTYIGVFTNCSFTSADGSIKNETIYANTLTTFINNQTTNITDVLQNAYNINANGKTYLQSQYLFSYNRSVAEQVGPYTCNGNIQTMQQNCSNNNFSTYITYNCVFNNISSQNVICQQIDANSTGATLDETKFLNIQTGLQYVQYGNSSQIYVKYCQTDLTTLNDNCTYLLNYSTSISDQRSNNSFNLTFENTGNYNLTINWLDQFGNEQLYQNLPVGYIYQQQTVSGDNWVIRNSLNNQIILKFVAPGRNQYIKIPASSASVNSSQVSNITLNNQLNYSVSLSLLDTYQNEITYHVLTPGENYNQYTVPGNLWVLRNATNQREIFTIFGSILNQTYNISSQINQNQINQTINNFSQKINYTLNCTSLIGSNVQNCTDGYLTDPLFCNTVNQSLQCATLSNKFQKIQLLQSNITFIANQQNAFTVMKCNNSFDSVFSNQSCYYLYTVQIPKVNSQNLIYQMKNSSSYVGIQATLQEGLKVRAYKKVSGSQILTIMNNSNIISECSYNLNGLFYCTTDKSGLNFSVQQCSNNQQYRYIGCQIVNYVQCKSFNTSGCIYSVYYDKLYDWNNYLQQLQKQNQNLSQNSSNQLQIVNNSAALNVYKNVQTQVYYDKNNVLQLSLDTSYGQLCFTLDNILCVNPLNQGLQKNGSYCYTYNDFSCFKDTGINCNTSSGYLCSTSDGVNPLRLSYCVSFDNKSCYTDSGQLCGSQNLQSCNISRLTTTCQSSDGASCYSYNIGWRFTQDRANTYQNALSNGANGSYCYTTNGNSCNRKLISILRQETFTCLTNDNSTCLNDNGNRCNSTDHLNWCNIPYNSISCNTLDMINCLEGIWIKTTSTPNQSGNTTFCYSKNGKDCKISPGGVDCQSGNTLSTYLCSYYKNNYTLKNITQCLSYDNVNCYNDVETNCGNSQYGRFCSIYNTDNYCQTINNVNCSTLSPGIFFTYDGLKISQIYQQAFQLQGEYCYSSTGILCDLNYGPQCNPYDGSYCATYNKVDPVLAIQCIQNPNDFRYCQKDLGLSCNPSQTNYDGSCGLTNQTLCLSADKGNTCLLMTYGWYYTQDQINVYSKEDPNGIYGAYCYSIDGKKCQISYDSNCTYKQNKSQCVNTTQCLSLDNQSCYYDTGSLCNATGKLNSICKVNLFNQNCSTTLQDGKSCFNLTQYNIQISNLVVPVIQNLWCFSIDGAYCYDPSLNQNLTQGLYCQTKDSIQCYQDYGPKCNQSSGYLCTTSDRVNFALVSYCASQDNQTCVRDQGSFCNSQINSLCNISSNQGQCISLDGINCYDFVKRWYFTTDLIKVYLGQINQGVIGSYCYSTDGYNCISKWNNFISYQVSNCLSNNNLNCYQDSGALCSNAQNINYCSINNNAKNCDSIDRQTCSNINWIRKYNSSSLCYSIDGKNCLVTQGGINCQSQVSDYLCSYVNGTVQSLTLCLSYDGQKCYQCQNANYKKCFTQGDTKNICNTVDGQNCLQLQKGWYFTNDGQAVSALPNLTQSIQVSNTYGFYCQSNDSYRCQISNGPNCNQSTETNCAYDYHQNLINVSQCITIDKANCYQDQGSICAVNRQVNASGSCALQNSQVQCSTVPNLSSHNCYDYISGWYFTIDGQTAGQLQNQNGQNGTYCFSRNGNSCYSNNGKACDLTTGYKCSSSNRIFLSQVTYCITSDNLNCIQDLGNKCNKTNIQGRCNINNDTNNCETLDGLTCYQDFKGWFVTFDGLTVGLNAQYQNQLRSYCYSEDGQFCKQTFGHQCNSSSGYECTSTDGISLAKSTDCISFNNQTCYQDYGTLCNYTGQFAWCNIYSKISNCTSLDGNSCYDFKSGWYATQNFNQLVPVNSLQQSNGYYCFSNDTQTCYTNYGSSCVPSTGQMCSTSDGITPQLVDYCISDDLKNCKQDNGIFCNYTGTQTWCNIYTYYQSCMTMLGNGKCYNPNQRYYMTYDGINVNTLPNGLNGYLASYCYSNDGSQCYQDYGNNCNKISGSNCSTSNGVNLQQASYCISANNKTCFQDVGSLCNNTNSLNWCKIKNNTNACLTQDSQNCFNVKSQYCFSFDGVYCTTQAFSTQSGIYCWSNDGIKCSNSGVPRCNSTIQVCSAKNATFCVTSDYLSCLSDTGYFCNSTYNLANCKINYDLTQFCETYDSINCVNQGSLLQNYTQDQIQRRNLRQYFFYAIQGNIYNVKSPGACSSDCANWKDKCCVNVQKQVGNQYVLFDNLCMNTYVAQNSMNFQLNGNQYLLTCVKNQLQKAQATIIKLFSISLIAIISLITFV